MNKRFFTTICIILAVSLAYLLLSRKNDDDVPFENEAKQSPESDGESSTIPAIRTDSSGIEQLPEYQELTAGENDPQKLAYFQAYFTPIEYYGKVVDVEGSPIQNAEIVFSFTNKPLDPLNGSTVISKKSREDGTFSIDEIRGTSLSVRVRKPGYHSFQNELDNLRYAPPRSNADFPTRDDPAVFVLEKLNEAVELFSDQTKQKLDLNGTPSTFSLFNGVGTLKIKLNSDYDRSTYDYSNWDALITLSNGGFIETEDTYNFEAPEEGYISEIEYKVTEEMEPKRKSMNRTFYFTLNDGAYYGRMDLDISAAGGYRVKYNVNPSGERNLNSNR